MVKVERTDHYEAPIDHDGNVTLILSDGDSRSGISLPTDPELTKKIEAAWEGIDGSIPLIEALSEGLIVECKICWNLIANCIWAIYYEVAFTVYVMF